ncbi:tyrosine-type recombinase/integrase [Granulicella tundricola]|uniref:Integrase family protein n=1 Tax=Granulicella tundricola (strain ATCC BAA-1859 / DSM 23138 / MP5ACTX9) TaxID=1198114 RepID=E8X2N1_GRATM|nr:tyrosine-type recombinase/integrase [Granulicella tundricola]ADW70328.1 integrase family protein [Granulicella tundricola MP5ACTX9]
MKRKRRYQQGTLSKSKTAEGICWFIRFVDTTPGNPKRPRLPVGLLAKYPTEASASRAAQVIRDQFNDSPDPLLADRRTFGDLIDRYLLEEIPERHSTRRGYEKLIRCHIRPRWGEVPIASVKAQEVRTWLRELAVTRKKGDVPISSPASGRYKGHVHNMMRLLFRFGMLWEWVPNQTNPMSLFSLEGSTKREEQPGNLTEAQFHLILAKIVDPGFRVMVMAAMCLGLRVSELLALKWEDFDFELELVRIQRAVVEGKVGNVKTIHSKKPLPLDPLLAGAFRTWRAASQFNEDDDWVFPTAAGERPYAASAIQTRVLIPVGKAIGLEFSLGWHTFRHSYKTWMDIKQVPMTVQRDLMRHADVRTTMQVYGDVRMEELRGANSDVVRRVIVN